MPKLGIMQGRLSPPVNNQIQAFPLDYWEDEFPLCRELGLSSIEWIFEYESRDNNPLCSDSGIDEMMRLSKRYGVAINSVVADYFMVKELFGSNKSEISEAINTLHTLIERCKKTKISIIEIPFVDSSALETESDKEEVVQNLKEPLAHARESAIRISLETSLAPNEFREFILAFKPFDVKVNYDMGNSASLGYDPREEIVLLGDLIINIHIKDRIRGGSTVPLGTGDTDFNSVFKHLKEYGYSGDFILQAAREDLSEHKEKKDFVETIRNYVDFIKPYLEVFE